MAVQTSEQQEADPQERQPHFFPELLQPFFICLGHVTGASEFSHFISFIHHVLRMIDLEACGIKSLEGSSGSAIVAECGEADFCLEQVIG